MKEPERAKAAGRLSGLELREQEGWRKGRGRYSKYAEKVEASLRRARSLAKGLTRAGLLQKVTSGKEPAEGNALAPCALAQEACHAGVAAGPAMAH